MARRILVLMAVAVFVALGVLDLLDHRLKTGIASVLLAFVNLLLLS